MRRRRRRSDAVVLAAVVDRHDTLPDVDESASGWRSQVEVELAKHGFREVVDWQTTPFPTQVTGRIPPDWHWFYYRERSGGVSIEIYPPGRYPFALPGVRANAGFDPMALGQEPPVVWEHDGDTPDHECSEEELAVRLILELVDRWRRESSR